MGSHRGSKHHEAIPSGTWRRIRSMVLARDGYKCRRCKRYGRMEIHHVKPLHDGGENDLSNLVAMCRTCHMAFHQQHANPERWEWRRLTRALVGALDS